MKILILTHPLKINYGGLLQAYALQYYLRNLGHDVCTNTRLDYNPLKYRIISLLKRIIKFFIGEISFKEIIPFSPTKEQQTYIAQHTWRFVQENMKTIDFFEGKHFPSSEKIEQFDMYIVGSDQVWRPTAPNIKTYFFDFLEKYPSKKRISYAASFGVAKWNRGKAITFECAKLLQEFDKVLVREDSAIQICEKNFNVKALQVLDPTMLLSQDHYVSLVNADKSVKSYQGNLMIYILDKTTLKVDFIRKISNKLGMDVFDVFDVEKLTKHNILKIDKCIVPPVTQWLRGFMDAKFIITDSFHGVVFSIIFNKPFIALNNPRRGTPRFNSILNTFELKERFIDLSQTIDNLDEIFEKINFYELDNIEIIYKKEKIKTINLLNSIFIK